MNAIAFDKVSRSYGDVVAVAGLDLEIPRARTVALLGPNGAGKSTSISMLLGLIRPTSGTVRVFGRTPEEAVSGGEIGAMLQEGTLIPELTVAETVDFIRRLYPRPLGLDVILRMADLTEVAKLRADRLSGGQIQRVRFALAIAGAPRLLVLDEPTAAMDVESRRRFWASMRTYAADGHTVLFATHYLEEADENADRVIVIARGRVVADGTAAEIKAGVGGQTVSFAIGDQPSAALAALPQVSGVELRSGRAILRTADPDATIAALYRGTSLDVRDLRISGADLEDAFVALTREA
ncbi:ABC transporter ATP-binding protein [Acrocarpospora macrocephala]|uniref:ABC transporter ATP-binding protein n=1 Tax=Acrocarpospora macrocephala TaxID=150177 RepID=A0A5M3X583_9ACTN|nr:ABC transporter ATP-binding protein [Acrocarpospora macrocephala]GES14003.1 ABC transporter ATP-binding protein [Acrocarpospora macrocephala]